jgi:glycosyltransferase involved in cell wall biosynthesis
VTSLDIPPDRLVLIHNGIDPAGLVRPDIDTLRERRRALDETTFVLTSHIWANKCHHAALSAFKAVHARFPKTRLVFDGSVGHADVAEALANRIATDGLGAVVQIINSRSRKELSRVYTDAHAFILPSIVEGLSIATLEAAYFGLPMILSDTGGARDVLETTDGEAPFGIIIPPPIAVEAVTPQEVDRVGRMEEPPHLQQLTDAMMHIAGDREAWLDRGLAGIDRSADFLIEKTVAKYEAVTDLALTVHGSSDAGLV